MAISKETKIRLITSTLKKDYLTIDEKLEDIDNIMSELTYK
jgi:hypothetical protein